jgi:hypothetical protein
MSTSATYNWLTRSFEEVSFAMIGLNVLALDVAPTTNLPAVTSQLVHLARHRVRGQGLVVHVGWSRSAVRPHTRR